MPGGRDPALVRSLSLGRFVLVGGIGAYHRRLADEHFVPKRYGPFDAEKGERLPATLAFPLVLRRVSREAPPIRSRKRNTRRTSPLLDELRWSRLPSERGFSSLTLSAWSAMGPDALSRIAQQSLVAASDRNNVIGGVLGGRSALSLALRCDTSAGT